MNNKLQYTLAIAIVVVVTIGGTLLATTINKEDASTTKAGLTQVERDAFIDGCTEQGDTSRATCVCMLNYLEDRQTKSELIDLGKIEEADDVPDVLFDAAFECVEF